MIKYQEKLQDFYKMRDTLITEGYKDIENIKVFDKVELREIALEIIKEKRVDVEWLINTFNYIDYNDETKEKYWLTDEEYTLLKEVLL